MRDERTAWRRASSTPATRVGSALGLAAVTALATALGADTLGDLPALTGGYSAAFTGAAVIAAAGAVLAAVTLRGTRTDAAEQSQPSQTVV